MSATKLVFVLGKQRDIMKMFDDRGGFHTTPNDNIADIIVWPGGADVNPELYGQTKLGTTNINPASDLRDMEYWNEYKNNKVLKVGICRGSQWLNCMNGGKLWQHVNNHTSSHKLQDLLTDKEYMVSSTHHQMMRSSDKGEIIGIAMESTLWQDDTVRQSAVSPQERSKMHPEFDTEVVWYKNSRSLCFQPHPEMNRAGGTRDYFFDLIERVI